MGFAFALALALLWLKRLQIDPQILARGSKMSPRRHQRHPRRGQSRPKKRPERPQGAPRAPQGDFPAIQPPSGHHFEAQNQFFLVEKMFFYIVFAGRFFYRFLAAPGHPQTLKIKPNPCRGTQNQKVPQKSKKRAPGIHVGSI